MPLRNSLLIMLTVGTLATGCGDKSKSDDPGSGGGTGGTTPTDQHIVGSGAAAYAEKSEATNTCATPEATDYALNDTGTVITGAVEASNPTPDCFSFASGSATWVKARIFAGDALAKVPVYVQCAGYSQSQNLNGIERVGVEPNLKCNVIAWPAASDADTAYTIEMRASP